MNSSPGLNPYERELPEGAIAAKDHRQFVGGMWEKMGRLQFEFMKSHGLRPGHRFLDLGCGALRGGIHFIRYLDPGDYYGIDINRSLIEAAVVELQEAGLDDRRPNLLVNGDFDFASFGVRFPYALAQSVFTHLPRGPIRRCLERIAEALEPGGRFFATYFEAPVPDHAERVEHPGGITTHLDANPFHQHPSELEQMTGGLPLRMRNLGDWGHPRSQRMLEFVRDESAPQVRDRASSETRPT